jgi:hypothetical protein
MVAYEAFAASVIDRLGQMPTWDRIPPEARADWRAAADAVLILADMKARDAPVVSAKGPRPRRRDARPPPQVELREGP